MKKLLFFLFFAVVANAQTHRFIYEMRYKKDSAEASFTKENWYLDINPKESFYYERPYFVSDSIFKATKQMGFSGKMTDILRKDLATKEYSTVTFQGFETFILKDKPSQIWHILPETKTANTLKLQKATTRWAGRNWTAWFANELPFSEGPYKFGGLPGLIAEVSDDKGNYDIRLVKSENLSGDFVLDLYKNVMSRGRAVEIPYSKFAKMKLQNFATPVKAAHDGTFDVSKTPFITEYGTKISTEQQLRDYEDAERKNLRKNNNPIELDKAIHYPDK